MTLTIELAQPGILDPVAPAGYSLEWDLHGDPTAAWTCLGGLDPNGAVIGLGQPLLQALDRPVPGLRAFPALHGAAVMPSTQHALWAYVADATPGGAFAQAEALVAALEGCFTLKESTPLFRYRDSRDLTGYRDGTGNPEGDDAAEAALIAEGPEAGGAFALVQRFVHRRDSFFALEEARRDDVVGRRLSDDEEFDEAPESSHVKRTDQEGYDRPAFMVRRSMPWGDLKRHGLQFIAYVAQLDRLDLVLRRMCGLEDGVADALLGYTEAETGAYYYCPPRGGKGLRLP